MLKYHIFIIFKYYGALQGEHRNPLPGLYHCIGLLIDVTMTYVVPEVDTDHLTTIEQLVSVPVQRTGATYSVRASFTT